MTKDIAPGLEVRRLLRRARKAVLSSALARDGSGWPYGALVLLTVAPDASPLLLLSDLSDHSKNIAEDPRVSLLLDGTEGYRDPLAGPRAAVLGEAKEVVDQALKGRVLARHPGAKIYAGFKDFRLFRVSVTGAHLVAGFGRIHWLEAKAVIPESPASAAFEGEQAQLLARLNGDLSPVIQALGKALAKGQDGPWEACGVDPEGVDLRAGDALLRLDLPVPLHEVSALPAALSQVLQGFNKPVE